MIVGAWISRPEELCLRGLAASVGYEYLRCAEENDSKYFKFSYLCRTVYLIIE